MPDKRNEMTQPCGHPVAAIRGLSTTKFCAACVAVDLGRCPCARCLEGACHACGDSINIIEQNWRTIARESRTGIVHLHAGCVATFNQREGIQHAG